MKGHPKVLEYLSEVLKAELTAINQYFLHGEMMEDWGYSDLAKLTKKKSIDDMKQAEALMERILFLEGMPRMDQLFPLRIGESVKQQIENDLALELDAIPLLNNAINEARAQGDNGSSELLKSILADEEKQVDFLEAQLHQIKEIGYDNYLAQWMGENED